MTRRPNICGLPEELRALGPSRVPAHHERPLTEQAVDQAWREVWAPALDELDEADVLRIRCVDDLVAHLLDEGRVRLCVEPAEARWAVDQEAWQRVTGPDDPPWPPLDVWRRRCRAGEWPVEIGPMSDDAARWLLVEYGAQP